jgi:hypothetical protein
MLRRAPTVYWALLAHLPRFERRSLHLFCVGTPKSGTSSIAGIFDEHYRSAHEPLEGEFIEWIVTTNTQRDGHDWFPADSATYLQSRDRELSLEVESNHLLIHCLEDLDQTFPDAKYIFTIRDCYTWLNSVINQQIVAQSDSDTWDPIHRLQYASPAHEYDHADRKLADWGLYPVSAYFSYWAWHNRKVLDVLPPSSRITIRTGEISERLNDIADFVDVPRTTLSPRRSHANRRSDKQLHILDLVDSNFLHDQAHRYCKEIMDNIFPSIDAPSDVFDQERVG